MNEKPEKPVRLKKDGTPDKRANHKPPSTFGPQEVPKIDYASEDGPPPSLLVYRYVAQYQHKGKGEDGAMVAARKMKRRDPAGFLEKLETLEKEWAERRPSKLSASLPLEVDKSSQKCLDAINEFLERILKEANCRAEVIEKALRGELAV